MTGLELKRSKDKVERYEYDGFYVDIVKKENGCTEAWICKKDYGVAELMFGLSKGKELDVVPLICANFEREKNYYLGKYTD